MKFKNNTYLYGLKIRKEIKLNFNSDISTSIFPLSSFLDLYSSIYDLSKIKTVLINGNNHHLELNSNNSMYENHNILIILYDANIVFNSYSYFKCILNINNCFISNSSIWTETSISLLNNNINDTSFTFYSKALLTFDNTTFTNCNFISYNYSRTTGELYKLKYPTCTFINCNWDD